MHGNFRNTHAPFVEEDTQKLIDLCSLPMSSNPTFASPVQMMFWLLRHQESKLVRCWWLGFEMSTKGRSFDRVLWEIENNRDKYLAVALGMKTSELVRMAEEAPDEAEVLPHLTVPRIGGRPVGKTTRVAFPIGALVRNPAAVEMRQEIGRALGTLPKETR